MALSQSSQGFLQALFPTSGEDYEKFRDALGKLRLNDAALQYEPENSDALGFWISNWFLRSSAYGDCSRET